MRKTTNYGLSLYDKEDKMNITSEENSLNANMEIIDSTLKNKASITDMTNYINEHKDELKGADGKDGANGKDGISATHSWNGTTLTITSASGTSSANLKGEKGEKGDTGATGSQGQKGDKGDKGDTGSKGADGKTPVKGIDYFTVSEQETFMTEIIDLLGGTPIFGTVDTENNIILSGALTEGTYIIKYEDGEGNIIEIGTLNHGGEYEPGVVNLVYIYETKIDKTTGKETSSPDYHTHEPVPYNSNFTYKVTLSSKNNFYITCCVCWYDADGMYLGWNEVGGNEYTSSLGGQNTGTEFVNYSRNLVPLENARYFKLRIYSSGFKGLNGVNGMITVEKVKK